MPKLLSKAEIAEIVTLRECGHSLPEIRRITGKANGTIFGYIQGVEVKEEFKQILKEKQGGSKQRAVKNWELAKKESGKLIEPPFSKREKLLILAALYWGEGTKQELNIINSDSALLRVATECMKELGIQSSDFKITLRVYGDCDIESAKSYWADSLGVSTNSIQNVNVLSGKKEGKLPYGMCRIRVTKGARYFKLIMSMINLVKHNI